jgi:DNA-3-methyladenine glycosylase I
VKRRRCAWAEGGGPLEKEYHDSEWGVPSFDDRHLFEMLSLEGAQAGLSWSTILRKRDGYRRAFAGFDPVKVSRPLQNRRRGLAQLPAETAESRAMSKDLLRRGFRFVGSVTCYALMQAVGMVNDHEVRCFRHGELRGARRPRRRP